MIRHWGGLALLILVNGAWAAAPSTKNIKAQQHDLRGRIENLKQDIAKTEASQEEISDQLRAIESAISETTRQLHQLATQRGRAQAEVQQLAEQTRQIDQQMRTQQAHLSRLLVRHATLPSKETDPVRRLLSSDDPHRTGLDSYFLQQLSRAKAQLIAELRESAGKKKDLTRIAQEKHKELLLIEKKQKEEQQANVRQQKQRQTLMGQIAGKLKAQRQTMGSLQRDEKRLTQVIENLKRVASKPAPSVKPGKGSPTTQREPDLSKAGGAFVALKGKLRWPVSGNIAGRFGKARPEGGARWRGLFIRASEGGDVQVVASGVVVFSDWLRGFGNLLVVDHDDDFLSVYANNQSLLRQKDEKVRVGDAIATVGNSGGNAESGLYFELRHRGQPFDPMKWLVSR
ncbi:MAG: peptidoglycan DD-metalloendopeptidase family protein [Rhodocyclaceae bacterium]|nr:peptidoglycan DD-metalloendopeptidase family protein [Rhodocyclaceae bacterium]